MGSPHFRHFARKRNQETRGMLSYQAMGFLQRGQRLPGETMLSPFGTRAITTLRKLPTVAPAAKTQRWNTAGSAEAGASIRRWQPFLPRARRRGPPASGGAG